MPSGDAADARPPSTTEIQGVTSVGPTSTTLGVSTPPLPGPATATEALHECGTAVLDTGPPDLDFSRQDDRNLFVFHIPGNWREETLHRHFRPFGPIVSAIISRESQTGRNKGFGFVCYHSAADAQKAITEMNGAFVGGKRLAVKLKLAAGSQRGGEGGLPAVVADEVASPPLPTSQSSFSQLPAQTATQVPAHISVLERSGRHPHVPPLSNENLVMRPAAPTLVPHGISSASSSAVPLSSSGGLVAGAHVGAQIPASMPSHLQHLGHGGREHRTSMHTLQTLPENGSVETRKKKKKKKKTWERVATEEREETPPPSYVEGEGGLDGVHTGGISLLPPPAVYPSASSSSRVPILSREIVHDTLPQAPHTQPGAGGVTVPPRHALCPVSSPSPSLPPGFDRIPSLPYRSNPPDEIPSHPPPPYQSEEVEFGPHGVTGSTWKNTRRGVRGHPV
uniref:RRM domain-containing protein n=1 Tax=Chromera velia CCMP2878 TaxID=1169474 RepID=A0A0G4I2Y5_9ALVE|eukprot:Cvel_10531.t1-p1 / transcript=Cvel_10531.t1 / gene=Cvel_10531 / organism=Chromera_velia_CCMP2878 / gene_product=Polyadenylate-binding protein 1-B, putative / transcript_product=Polyadenylate-binding protein 1-B, putative / location=Cvel_scaffold637:44095-46020(-) / protein_length=450 / sequence_SO=supercontig / SO=protein_coding / is_pseudo=false